MKNIICDVCGEKANSELSIEVRGYEGSFDRIDLCKKHNKRILELLKQMKKEESPK